MIPVLSKKSEILDFYKMYPKGVCIIKSGEKRKECNSLKKAMRLIAKYKID